MSEFKDIFAGIDKLSVEHDIRLATGANHVDSVVCAASQLPFRGKDVKKTGSNGGGRNHSSGGRTDRVSEPDVGNEQTGWRRQNLPQPFGTLQDDFATIFCCPHDTKTVRKGREGEILLQYGRHLRILPDSSIG